MTTRSYRVQCLTVLHVCLFGLAASTAPSDPMAARLADVPDAAQVALVEELAGWVGDEASPKADLGRRIREQPISFEIFRTFHDEGLRLRPLADVPFGQLIRRVAARHGVDPLLVASVIEAESGFQPAAVSHRGAIGLMQVMPRTSGLTDLELLADPGTNLNFGVGYLGRLIELHSGDLELALAAYNAGPANVRRYKGVPPFQETRGYVKKVLARYVEHHRSVWRATPTGQLLIDA